MEMLMMGGALSLLGFAVVCLAFGAAVRAEREKPIPVQPETVLPKPAPSRFFVTPRTTSAQVPIEALLLQIESHVRLEQAAAQSFLEYPTSALLHSRTVSPLIQ
jgi:hypothetical protein